MHERVHSDKHEINMQQKGTQGELFLGTDNVRVFGKICYS